MTYWLLFVGFMSFCLGHFWGRTENDKEWMMNCAKGVCLYKHGHFYKVLTEDRWVELSLDRARLKSLESGRCINKEDAKC